MVRQKLGLYFGANAQLTIHPFMAPRFLQQLVVLNATLVRQPPSGHDGDGPRPSQSA